MYTKNSVHVQVISSTVQLHHRTTNINILYVFEKVTCNVGKQTGLLNVVRMIVYKTLHPFQFEFLDFLTDKSKQNRRLFLSYTELDLE